MAPSCPCSAAGSGGVSGFIPFDLRNSRACHRGGPCAGVAAMRGSGT